MNQALVNMCLKISPDAANAAPIIFKQEVAFFLLYCNQHFHVAKCVSLPDEAKAIRAPEGNSIIIQVALLKDRLND